MTKKIAVVPGDGIGPEVIAAGMRILEHINDKHRLKLEFVHFDWNADEYLRTVAIARIVLDDVPNLQASWVTMGMKVGQIALRFGCNDFGSLMIEENVVSAANTTHRTSTAEMERLISDAGFRPVRRRQDYSLIESAANAA